MRALISAFLIVVLAFLVGCHDLKSADKAKAQAKRADAVAAADRGYAIDSAPFNAPDATTATETTAAADAPGKARTMSSSADPSTASTAREPSTAVAPPETAPDAVRLQTVQPRAANPSRYRPGTLTAGSFDDHARYREYREYLSAAMQRDPNESLPRLAMGERIVVRVINAKNEPVNDVVVQLHDPQKQQPVGSWRRTASDGRVTFLSTVDHFPTDGELVAQVVWTGPYAKGEVQTPPPQPSAKIERTAIETTLLLPDAPRNLPQQLDLSLVIDTTGSMSDELEYLKAEIDAIAATVHQRFPNVDQRYSLVVYRDEGDEYVARKFDFTGSLSEFQSSLSAQQAGGGGDYPEAMHVALEQAESLAWRKDNTARVLFLLADAPPHRQFAGEALRAVQLLRAKGVTIFPVAASGVQDEAEFVLRGTAFLTRGRYLFLTDHSGVGNPHARPNVPDFEVERLDQLMTRMIVWKLSGEETGMREILATSEGEDAAAQAAGGAAGQNPTIYPDPASAGSPTSPVTTRRSSRPGLFVSIVGELWRTDYWLRPNRYWLLGLIIIGILILDRREQRRRAMNASVSGCRAQ